VAKQFDGNVGVCYIVKNSLAKKILLERARVSVKGRLGLGGAIKMMPSLGGHALAGKRAQIAKAHLFQPFFRHIDLSYSFLFSNFLGREAAVFQAVTKSRLFGGVYPEHAEGPENGITTRSRDGK
jgi:hypothetical protein